METKAWAEPFQAVVSALVCPSFVNFRKSCFMMRNKTFSIIKAIAIILIVLYHSGAPSVVTSFVALFHLPVFFMCSGYFFKPEYIGNEGYFISRRFKKLYVPFIKWSIVLLCLHNLFFHIGILSETYGTATGGVLHPYSWHDFSQRVWSCLFNMSGYDEMTCGAFWFFRALFVGSIAFLFAYKLFSKLNVLNKSEWKIALAVALTALFFGGWQIFGSL